MTANRATSAGGTIVIPAGRTTDVLLMEADLAGEASFAIVTRPAHGRLDCLSPSYGFCLYTPDAGYSGWDSFSYIASRGRSRSDGMTIRIEVEPEPEPVRPDCGVHGLPYGWVSLTPPRT